VLALTTSGGKRLAEERTGRNRRHLLVGLLRPSVFARLADYGDVNDADRFAAIRRCAGFSAAKRPWVRLPRPARWALRDRMADPAGDSCCSCRSAGPMDLRGAQAASAAGRRTRYGFERKPDLRRTGRQRVQRAFRLHLLSPPFVFNQLGDLERCALRAGNAHSAASWREVLEPGVARYGGTVKRCYFRGDAPSPTRRYTSSSKPKAWGLRSRYRPIRCCKTRSATSSSTRSGDRRRCAATMPAFATKPAHGQSPDEWWPRSNGIRVRFIGASALSSPPRHGWWSVLSPSITTAAPASSTSKKARARQVDPAVMMIRRRHHRPPPAPRAAGDAEDGGAVVADQLAREADRDRRQGREPRPLHDLSDGRGRGAATDVPGDPDVDRPTSGAAGTHVTGR
jgi:hypothetical protein